MQQRPRLLAGNQADDVANKDRDCRVENRDDKAGDKKGGNEMPRLARIMPIKRCEPRPAAAASGGTAVGSNRLSKNRKTRMAKTGWDILL